MKITIEKKTATLVMPLVLLEAMKADAIRQSVLRQRSVKWTDLAREVMLQRYPVKPGDTHKGENNV